jgi:hypothetical protein
MLYLMSAEIGSDDDCIGFPSVQTCLAVLVQTSSNLVGWHSYNTTIDVTKDNAATFAAYVGKHAKGPIVNLYTASNKPGRGGFWRAELREIASALGYTGKATMFDMGIANEGVYVEFRRNGGSSKCKIYYKRNGKMTYTTTETNTKTMVQRAIVKGNAKPQKLYDGGTGTAPIYTGAALNHHSKRGNLNPASSKHIQVVNFL